MCALFEIFKKFSAIGWTLRTFLKKISKILLFSDINKANKIMREKWFIIFVDSLISFTNGVGTLY